MRIRIAFLIGLIIALTTTGTVVAQEPVTPQMADPTWEAFYWNNMTLSGPPDLQREEAAIDHDWGTGAPPNIQNNRFSARWTRYIDVSAGVYRFTATSDDGIRVWIDDELIIDAWYDHPAQTFTVEKSLSAGLHWVVVEYYENGGFAETSVSWIPLSTATRNWQASYWNNTTLSGTPDFQRVERNLDHDWGTGSPHPSINPNNFSARWTRSIDVPAGLYRFTATSDDGIRVWVDNELVIDEWYDHAPETFTAEKQLADGQHFVVVEYYESQVLATAQLSWTAISTEVPNWQAEYFNNMTLSGTPALVRTEGTIDFNWGISSPAPDVIPPDTFSVRWTQSIELPAGRYRFEMTVDDGGRLWVRDRLLIAAWQDQAATTYTADIYLSGGETPVRMEYYENGGAAVAALSWSRIGIEPEPDTIIIDNTDPNFSQGGAASNWHSAPEGFGGELNWTRNSESARPGYNWVRWYPNVTPGLYQVEAYIPQRFTTTANARYFVIHEGGSTLRTVDQSLNGGQWVSLGTYRFNGSPGEYVMLSDVTFEDNASRLIAFDAVRWVPQ